MKTADGARFDLFVARRWLTRQACLPRVVRNLSGIPPMGCYVMWERVRKGAGVAQTILVDLVLCYLVILVFPRLPHSCPVNKHTVASKGTFPARWDAATGL